MKTEQETQETQEPRQTITIDNKVYFKDSLDEESQLMLSDIFTVQEAESEKQKELRIVTMAKVLLIDKLAAKSEQFERVPELALEDEEIKTPEVK